IIDGKIQRCNNQANRPLKQLVGIWKLDFNEVNSALNLGLKNALEFLGVCNKDGHIFQQRGKGTTRFSCSDKHHDDTTNSLYILGQWIQEIASTSKKSIQNMLLQEMTSILVRFFQRKTNNDNEKIETSQSKLPSFIAFKTALRLKKVNIKRLQKAQTY
ncbi:7010_t:CDS:2, partial [Ambispora gerdemannii]